MTKNNFFKKLALSAVLFLGTVLQAQIKVGNNPTSINTNSVLEMESTNKGMLLPRLALTNTTAASPLIAHVAGMTVYNTATAGDVTPGFYYNNGTVWVRVGSATASNNTTSGQLITITNGAGATFTAMTVAVDTTALKTFISNAVQTGSITGKNTTAGSLVTVTNGTGATFTAMTVGVDTTALKTFLNGKIQSSVSAPLTGNGTASSPLGITQNTLSAGQLTTVTGGTNATFTAATVGIDTTALKTFLTSRGIGADNWGTQTAVTSAPISGNGTTGSPITMTSVALATALKTSPAMDTVAAIARANGDGDAWGVTGENQTSNVGRTGSVGIGNTSPSAKLEVTGNAKVTTKPTALVTDSVVMRFTDGELRQMSIARLLGQFDTDGDGIPDATDPDIDGDGVLNAADTCAKSPGCLPTGCPKSCPVLDTDGDGIPDYSDPDIDGDGIANASDTCKMQYGCNPSGCQRSCASAAPSVVNDCNLNGLEGIYRSGTAMTSSNKFTVSLTNNSFSSATISFATSDLVLSGITGLSVSTVSPATVTLGAGQSQTVTYSFSGTPSSCGTLTASWTKLTLNCTRTIGVSPAINCSAGSWTTNISPAPIYGIRTGVSYSGVYSIPYTGGSCTLPSETISSNGLTLTYTGGTISATGQMQYALSGTYTGTDSSSVTFTTSSGCKIYVGPFRSCKAILAAVPSATDGVYRIDVDSVATLYSPMNCQCDMTTDGGGWTLVYNAVVNAVSSTGTISNYAFTNKFPLIVSNTLGSNEQGNTISYGYAGSTIYNNWYTPTHMLISGRVTVGASTNITLAKATINSTMLTTFKSGVSSGWGSPTITDITGGNYSIASVNFNDGCCDWNCIYSQRAAGAVPLCAPNSMGWHDRTSGGSYFDFLSTPCSSTCTFCQVVHPVISRFWVR